MTEDGRLAALARVLWDYLRVGRPLARADAVLAFGSRDLRPGRWGGKLLVEGWAPLLIASGGRGRSTRDWPMPEAEALAAEARAAGAPAKSILLEDRSTNTGENVRFSRRLAEEKGLDLRRVILVHVPFMERRVLATFERYWPGAEGIPSSPPISFEDSWAGPDRGFLVRRLAGEVARMVDYPGRGFQAPAEVPEPVVAALRELEELGFGGDQEPPSDAR